MQKHHYASQVQIGVSESWPSGATQYVPRPTPYALERHDLTVLLIHGFNVLPWKARLSYGALRDNLLGGNGVAAKLHVVSVGWPGDVNYPSAPGIAMATAGALADYIELLNPPGFERVLYIVCHSLGCRYALEALRVLQSKYDSRLPRRIVLFLLAAAVPVEFSDTGGRLAGLLPTRVRATVYFSETDGILRWLFPLGQRASIDKHSVAIEAVGLRGNPKSAWTGGSIRMARYGHGDYWKSKEIAQQLSDALSDEVGARPLSIPERQIKPRMIGK